MADAKASPSDIAQVVAPVTAVVAVFTSLAVTGVIAEAQRNEGDWLIAAFACIVGGAVAWLVGLLIPEPEPVAISRLANWVREHKHPTAQFMWWLRRRGGALLQMLGVLALGAGIVLGIVGLVKTQQGSERPAVSASFMKNSSTLTAKVEDHGLASGRRVTVLVQGLDEKREKKELRLIANPKTLYFALIGPDKDGDISHEVKVYVPKAYQLVGVRAWTGETDPGCTIFEEGDVVKSDTPPGEQDGCLALRLPVR